MFQSELKDILKKLSSKEYSSPEERDQLLGRLQKMENVRGRDVTWLLFRPDRALRDAGVALVKRIKDPETVDLFLQESKGKPEAAIRAAAQMLFSLGIPGTEARLIQLLGSEQKETREAAKRLIAEAPVTKNTEPLLWQLAASGTAGERVGYLSRLAGLDPDPQSIQRWQKLATDPEQAVREKALEVLAQKDPAGSVQLFVDQLGVAGYSTQQLLVGALTRAAEGQGPEFAGKILPLMASGDPATRSAVLKILLQMPNRREVVRKYIAFSKTLAGWARDRALESMKAFGDDLLEPTLELLKDPDDEMRGAATLVVSSFSDPRVVPAMISMLNDSDWWIRISAVETLGRLRDPKAVDPLLRLLEDPDVRWSAVEALGRIGDPRALPALGKLLGDPNPDIRIEIIQSLRNFRHPQVPAVLQKITQTDPNRTVRSRALEMAEEIAARDKTELADAAGMRAAATTAKSKEGEPKLHALLVATRNQKASDLHLSVDQPPTVRISAELMRAQAPPFTADQTKAMLREILTDDQWAALERDQQLDFCYYIPQAGRYRANLFLDQKGYNAVFRVIPEQPPTITEIGLPSRLAEIADFHQGLVLICGPSGSGKSTTLAALVNLFNETRHDHVLTMEDPVEFVHPFKNCLINQREVGSHTKSFARALRAALREDPDVIVIGEMRDNETVELALTAAETGHIVLGTLNSTSAPKAIDRVISSFPVDQQPQIRMALSESLKYVVAQRLVPARERGKQVAVFEVLKGTASVANMIRDEKTYQIPSAMQIGRNVGMQTVDDSLRDLVRRNLITPETAYLAADKKEDFEPLVSEEFLTSQLVG